MTEPQIITFGCRMNAFESEVMRRNVKQAGLNEAVIINTCTVTAEATRQARQSIRRARRERPRAKIIVTGCAAQLDPESFASMPEVDRVLGNAEKLDAANFGADLDERVLVNDIMSVTENAGHLIDGFDGRARAFVQIQNGCDHRCTFCIIPFARGPSRSVARGAIVAQVQQLVENGYNEVVLTGVNITDYGRDLPGAPSLSHLIESLLAQVPNLKRLRLSSIDPVDVDARLIDLLGNQPRLMPHLHLSLQAGDDMVLKRMKRRHTRTDAIKTCEKIRNLRPDTVFGADLIAGFPTESDAMFENSLRLVDDCGLTYLHVFPYSVRPGTPAAKMPQTPGPIAKARAAKLRAAGTRALQTYLDRQTGTETDVLMETDHGGRTPQFAGIKFAEAQTAGAIVRARVLGRKENTLLGVTL
ncbi:MAG TPA: tRNA (N(6)-L-threonylcarbamoyladenosine(37)-C(2))-methylthiotransferase MtaB [Sneathiellales bacterium]|nr:tRNA (N(6)-L-threonylcarbamoyladenosine(37)-C(2))-methylthiotransferase MtaB [Sneathiellales bacterium]